MKTLYQKLKLEGKDGILVLNEPEGFSENLLELMDIEVFNSLVLVNKIEFALLFVQTIEEFENQMISLAPKLKDDVILWVAHPRTSSQKFETDITNSYNWAPLIKNCYEHVGHVKVNDDWEAMRFRKLEYIHCKDKNK